MGHRMSSLETTQFCGLVGTIGKKHGAGRAAAQSSAWHARVSGSPHAAQLLARLTEPEREDILTWLAPVDVVLEDVTLRYEDAEKEVEVTLDSFGEATDLLECAVTVGHLDFAWVVERGGERWAYVADLKRSKWTPSANPDSLQLHAYGRAYAKKMGCAGYVTGIWAAIEGEWRWAREAVPLDTVTAEDLWERIFFAATHESDTGSVGPHCEECFSRTHCPEYLLPPSLAITELAPVCDGVVPDPEKARELLTLIKRAEKMAEAAEKQLKALVQSGALKIVSEDGAKMWVPVTTKGRMGLDEEKLKKALEVDDLEPYKTRGASFDQYRWITVGKGR